MPAPAFGVKIVGRRFIGRPMFVLSSFIIGYLFVHVLEKRCGVTPRQSVTVIVAALAAFAFVHVFYEFWAPWPGSWDAAFYKELVVGRYRGAAESGVLAFLLGMAVRLLRSRMKKTLQKAGLVPPTQGEGPRARGFP